MTANSAVATAAADAAVQARQVYRQSAAAGRPVSGKELGLRFNRSERWGRDRIAEVRAEDDAADDAAPAATQRQPEDSLQHRETTADDGGRQPEGNAAVPLSPAPAPARHRGGRFVSWVGFVFGSVMSIAANVLHTWLPADPMPAGWTPGIAPQVGAAVWPIGLLLSVEVLSRVPWQRGRLWWLARYGGAGTVALGSAIISYGHLQGVLAAWGYGHLAAHVGPLVLDGLMVISGFALLSMSGRKGGDQ